jgi:hypothetical protein
MKTFFTLLTIIIVVNTTIANPNETPYIIEDPTIKNLYLFMNKNISSASLTENLVHGTKKIILGKYYMIDCKDLYWDYKGNAILRPKIYARKDKIKITNKIEF